MSRSKSIFDMENTIHIRRAVIDDEPFIKAGIDSEGLDGANFLINDFVVAYDIRDSKDGSTEKEVLLGFGRVHNVAVYDNDDDRHVMEISSLFVVEGRRRGGIGKLLLCQLIYSEPAHNIYIVTFEKNLCEDIGFKISKNPPKELTEKLKNFCHKPTHAPAGTAHDDRSERVAIIMEFSKEPA